MANDQSQKVWLQDSLNRIAIQRAGQAIEQTGRALPCRVTAVNGSIVTVAFEIQAPNTTLPSITIPKAEGQWIRSPTQVGDFGLTVPADARLGGISGLGGGVATLAKPVNLSALCWLPVASTAFSAVNTNAAYVSGPEGVVMQDSGGKCVFTQTPEGLTITVGTSTLQMTATGIYLTAAEIGLNGDIVQTAGSGAGTVSMIGPVTVTNDVTAATVSVAHHLHSDAGGSGDSGPPVPGT